MSARRATQGPFPFPIEANTPDGIRDEFILVPGDNFVSSNAFKNLRKFNTNVLLSGQAERWSKWGEIEVIGRG